LLAQDGRYSQRFAAGFGPPGGGFGFDLADQAEVLCSPGVGGKIFLETEDASFSWLIGVTKAYGL
jgi:hypothetical protein